MTAVVKWRMSDYWQGQPKEIAFYYTGAAQTWTVPQGVTQLVVALRGGAGGSAAPKNANHGGYVMGLLSVTPGDTLNIYVGGDGAAPTGSTGGAGGWNGGGAGASNVIDSGSGLTVYGAGGGGGASDIRLNGTALANRVVVAAGAGGSTGGYSQSGVWNGFFSGGGGGDLEGGQGYSPNYYPHGLTRPAFPTGDAILRPIPNPIIGPWQPVPFNTNIFGGQGGSQTTGGTLAVGYGGGSGEDGTSGVGGNAPTGGRGSGGGGGGLYGGSGGGYFHDATPSYFNGGGGGGSNYVAGLDVVTTNGQGHVTDQDSAFVLLTYQGISEEYTFDINPNDGGAVSIQKNILMNQTVGPNRVNILQEGTSQAPVITFSGVILTQGQLEALEHWYDRRVFIKMVDDLGREYYGVFSKFSPKRQRRASNFWYHTYDAEFTVSGYKNASGGWVYGRAG